MAAPQFLLRPLLLAICVMGSGCAAGLPLPTASAAAIASAHWPGTTVAHLSEGRRLYVNHCSSCHAPYRPELYPAEKWQGFVAEMSDRAKLTPDEAQSVIRYLVASAEAANPRRTTARAETHASR